MQARARSMVRNVRDGDVDTHPDLIAFWINNSDDRHELVHHALPHALQGESYATIDMFYSAIIMMPEFEAFDLHAAVRATRKLPPRKN